MIPAETIPGMVEDKRAVERVNSSMIYLIQKLL
jgi:hypothetical protein